MDLDDDLRLHEIRRNNRLRVLGHVMKVLRLPAEKGDALREHFDRVLWQIRHEIRTQVGTILSERFEFEVIEESLQEFALAIGRLVDGQRVSEGLTEARNLAGTVLSAAVNGTITPKERP